MKHLTLFLLTTFTYSLNSMKRTDDFLLPEINLSIFAPLSLEDKDRMRSVSKAWRAYTPIYYDLYLLPSLIADKKHLQNALNHASQIKNNILLDNIINHHDKDSTLKNELLFELLKQSTQHSTQVFLYVFNNYGIEDINMRSHCVKHTLLSLAVEKNNDIAVEHILSHPSCDSNGISPDNMPIIYKACQLGYIKCVKLLLAHPAFNFDKAKFRGLAPLHVAAEEGHLPIITLLLEQKESIIDPRCPNGSTPLHLACKRGHLNVIKFLVERGANINSIYKFDVTPSYIAFRNGHNEAVAYLLTLPGVLMHK